MSTADHDLDLLLKLSAVLGGSFTLAVVTRVWAALARSGVEQLQGAIQRGEQQRLIKPMASGSSSAGGRRRSSAAPTSARWSLNHLKIQEQVEQLMPRDVRVSLHAACAASLADGSVDSQQLAEHQHGAGPSSTTRIVGYVCRGSNENESVC